MAYPFARLISFGLRRIFYRRIRRRKHRQVVENFTRFLPDQKNGDAFYEDCYRQLFYYVVEEFQLRILGRRRILAGCRFEGLDLIGEHLKAGRKVIVATAHLGNLDWVWLALCLNFPKTDMAMVGRRLDVAWLDRHLLAMRQRFGQSQILNTDLGRVLLRRKSVPDILCLVTDLEPRGETGSQANTQFLGQPVTFYNTLPRVASRFGMHVIYLDVRRLAYGQFSVKVSNLSPPPKRDRLDQLQEKYVRAVEESVRSAPASWLFWWQRLIRQSDTNTKTKSKAKN